MDLDALADLAEREAELERRSVVWRARGRAFEARRARLLASSDFQMVVKKVVGYPGGLLAKQGK